MSDDEIVASLVPPRYLFIDSPFPLTSNPLANVVIIVFAILDLRSSQIVLPSKSLSGDSNRWAEEREQELQNLKSVLQKSQEDLELRRKKVIRLFPPSYLAQPSLVCSIILFIMFPPPYLFSSSPYLSLCLYLGEDGLRGGFLLFSPNRSCCVRSHCSCSCFVFT